MLLDDLKTLDQLLEKYEFEFKFISHCESLSGLQSQRFLFVIQLLRDKVQFDIDNKEALVEYHFIHEIEEGND